MAAPDNLQGHLPPQGRTATWLPMNEAAKTGRFQLQVCGQCQATQYPPREICRECLSEELNWQERSAQGVVLAFSTVHISVEAYFREHGPWHIASVQLDGGPVLVTYLDQDCLESGAQVQVLNRLDVSGNAIFISIAAGGAGVLVDPLLRALVQGG